MYVYVLCLILVLGVLNVSGLEEGEEHVVLDRLTSDTDVASLLQRLGVTKVEVGNEDENSLRHARSAESELQATISQKSAPKYISCIASGLLRTRCGMQGVQKVSSRLQIRKSPLHGDFKVEKS